MTNTRVCSVCQYTATDAHLDSVKPWYCHDSCCAMKTLASRAGSARARSSGSGARGAAAALHAPLRCHLAQAEGSGATGGRDLR